MKRISISQINDKLIIAFKRFPITIGLIIGFAILFFFTIHKSENYVSFPVWVFFSVGVLLSATVSLWVENLKNNLVKLLIIAGVLLLWGGYCFTLSSDKVSDVSVIQILILGTVFFLSLFFVSFFKKETDNQFWNFSIKTVIQLILAILFSSILFGGLCLALFAIDSLFGTSIDNKIYADLAVVLFSLFAPIYFLANIPYREEKYIEKLPLNKIFRILGLYIIFPLLAIYTLILYVYLFRAIIMWELPNGWVSVLTSILVAGGLLCLFMLHPDNKQNSNKLISWFSRYFGLIVLPLIVLMSIGIFRRVSDYGITINRCYVLLANIWFYGICIYLFLSRSKRIKWVFISFILIVFFSSIGPWSVFNITKRTLYNQIEKAFDQANLLVDRKISFEYVEGNDQILDLPPSQLTRIEESIHYLSDNYDIEVLQPLFTDSLNNVSKYEIITRLNFPKTYYNESNAYDWFSFNAHKAICLNIESYKYYSPIETYSYKFNQEQEDEVFQYFYDNGILTIKKTEDSRVFIIPLKEKVSSLISGNSESYYLYFSQEELAVEGEDYVLYIEDISGERYYNDSIVISDIRGYLFYK